MTPPPANRWHRNCEPLAAAFRTRWSRLEFQNSLLIDRLLVRLLEPDVLPDLLFVSGNRRHEMSPRPEVLTEEFSFPVRISTRDLNRALPLHEPDDVCHSVLRGNLDEHVNMIRHQVPLDDPTYFLFCLSSQNGSHVPSDLAEARLLPLFRDEDDVVLTLPTLRFEFLN